MPGASDVARPSVDVVVPFYGSGEELERLRADLAALRLRDGDTLTIVDNRPSTEAGSPAAGVVAAPERQSSYFARNAGARRGRNEWIVFIDADVRVPDDLIDRYFAGHHPQPDVGILAGGIVTTLESDSAAARYGYATQQLSPSHTRVGDLDYAQTANAMFRREAFEQVGGFCDHVRSGGDVDMSFRLQEAGWRLEPRYEAAVEHPTRSSLRKLLRLYTRYGSGAEWVRQRHPGFRPPRSRAGLVRWLLRGSGQAVVARARGDRDEAVRKVLDPAVRLAFELGRLFPNEVGASPDTAPGRLLARLARMG